MNKAKLIVLIVAVAVLASCGTTTTVPITGRKQHMMVSDEKVLSLSNQQYAEYMKTAKPSTNVANTNMVKRVGQNLANAVVAYLNANGLSSEVANYKWEFISYKTSRLMLSVCPVVRLWSMKDCCLSLKTRLRLR